MPETEQLSQEEIKGRVVEKLKQIYDPEIPVNIYDLGLIYRLELDDKGAVEIDMTLTAPACPVAQTFPGQVEAGIKALPEVSDARVHLVWDPPWDKQRLSEEAQLQLGLF